MHGFVPFCGSAPVPGTESWTLDARLIAGLFGILSIYLGASIGRLSLGKVLSFVAGWAILSLAFVTPICNLSVALFSARVTQHMIFVLLAGPLLAAGLPSFSRAGRGDFLLAAAAIFFVTLWLWHSPAPYDLTLRDNGVYWLMQITLVGASVGLWVALLSADAFASFAAITATGLHMSLLGALLAFAQSPLFSVYAHTTRAWGLTQTQDQNLGGLIMWAPSGLALTAYSVWALGLALHRMSRPAAKAGLAL